MKKGIFILFMFITISLYSITLNQIKVMQNNNELIVGKGKAANEKDADALALNDLASQIIVDVKGSFVSVAKEQNSNVDEYCESVINTFSDIQLIGAKKFVAPPENDKAIIYRYITPQDKDRIFNERKVQIFSLVAEGEIAEDDDNVVDAIRNYYWALMLLKTHPDFKTISYYFNERDRILNIALVNKIEKLLKETKIDIIKRTSPKDANYIDFVLEAKYKNKPADGLLVKYHDGYSWSKFERWSNGLGYFSISESMANTMKHIKLKIDYSFAEHGFSGEIAKTLTNMRPISFTAAEKSCKIKFTNTQTLDNQKDLITFQDNISQDRIKILDRIISSITECNPAGARKYFTAKGFRDYNELIGYGNAKILPQKPFHTSQHSNEI